MKFSLDERIPEEFKAVFKKVISFVLNCFSSLFRTESRNYVSTGSVFVSSTSVNFFSLFLTEEGNITLLFHGWDFSLRLLMTKDLQVQF